MLIKSNLNKNYLLQASSYSLFLHTTRFRISFFFKTRIIYFVQEKETNTILMVLKVSFSLITRI